MPAVPTLGYPTRTDAVLALRAGGMSTNEIAAALGITPNCVTAVEACARRARTLVQMGNRTILFSAEVLGRLAVHASRRGITTNELARRIVETALDDDMIDAVLDDRPPPMAAKERV